MTEELEQAIRELERATEEVLSAGVSDFAALEATLRSRAEAIRRIAQLVEAGAITRDVSLQRLYAAAAGGREAAKSIHRQKQEVNEDSLRLRQLLRGLEAAGGRKPARRKIDCTG